MSIFRELPRLLLGRQSDIVSIARIVTAWIPFFPRHGIPPAMPQKTHVSSWVKLPYPEKPESANQGTGAYTGFELQRLDSLDATRLAPPRDGASARTSLWLRPSEARQLGSSLIDILSVRKRHSQDEIYHAGLEMVMIDAETQARKLTEKAANISTRP